MTILYIVGAAYLLTLAAVCAILMRHGVRARDREAAMRRHPTNTQKDQP